mmetsp:Transcript_38712/g.79091  ORF Transcript_38712/g.79091 Transcript_38712/m.79091 type:complete len:208 (+) Transcript_38712:1013-1636(+)
MIGMFTGWIQEDYVRSALEVGTRGFGSSRKENNVHLTRSEATNRCLHIVVATMTKNTLDTVSIQRLLDKTEDIVPHTKDDMSISAILFEVLDESGGLGSVCCCNIIVTASCRSSCSALCRTLGESLNLHGQIVRLLLHIVQGGSLAGQRSLGNGYVVVQCITTASILGLLRCTDPAIACGKVLNNRVDRPFGEFRSNRTVEPIPFPY